MKCQIAKNHAVFRRKTILFITHTFTYTEACTQIYTDGQTDKQAGTHTINRPICTTIYYIMCYVWMIGASERKRCIYMDNEQGWHAKWTRDRRYAQRYNVHWRIVRHFKCSSMSVRSHHSYNDNNNNNIQMKRLEVFISSFRNLFHW